MHERLVVWDRRNWNYSFEQIFYKGLFIVAMHVIYLIICNYNTYSHAQHVVLKIQVEYYLDNFALNFANSTTGSHYIQVCTITDTLQHNEPL